MRAGLSQPLAAGPLLSEERSEIAHRPRSPRAASSSRRRSQPQLFRVCVSWFRRLRRGRVEGIYRPAAG
ncbi:MAG: hypothetical protein ACK56F_26195, partial [bacterium]